MCKSGPGLLQKAFCPVLSLLHPFLSQGLLNRGLPLYGRHLSSRCMIDNTSVIVLHGSGPEADVAPEMERFDHVFGVTFKAHAIGDADRKARVKPNFS